jgi:hypothetical protein
LGFFTPILYADSFTMRSSFLPCWVVLFAALLAAVPAARSQEAVQETSEETSAAEPDSVGAWDLALSSKVSASQAAYSNWTEGGISTLAFTGGVNGKANRTTRRWEQTYDLRLALGFIQQDTLDVRKADDLIKLGAALQYEGDGFFDRFNPTVAATARTQFAGGYNYDEVPSVLAPAVGADARPPVKVSDFMSPGVFTETVGLAYDPRPWFTQRFGLSSKQTVVAIQRLRPLYGLDADNQARIEAGLSATTEFDREVFKNVRLKSTLGLFSAFNQVDALPDATFENIVTMQVNEWLGVDFELTTLYDRDVSDALQVKEVLSVGLTFVLI